MRLVSFGNLTVTTRNEVDKTRELYEKLRRDNKVKGLEGELYKQKSYSVDGRLFPIRNSADIFETRIVPTSPTDEQELLVDLHKWASENKIDTRIDIDINRSDKRREQILDYSGDNLD